MLCGQMSRLTAYPYLAAVLLLSLGLLVTGQEFIGDLCASSTPFCWIPVEEHQDCKQACVDNSFGPQRVAVDAGDYTAKDGHDKRYAHWVCRAKGDQGEGYRSGFQLSGWNDGTIIPTSCTLAAHGEELSKPNFECLCSMPFPYLEEPDVIVTLSYGWMAAIMASATVGALLGVLAIHAFMKRTSTARYGLDTEISNLSHMKVPLHAGDGL